MIDLSIIIVSYNTREMTIECLESIRKAVRKEPKLKVEIFVVDNDSKDGSVEGIHSYIASLPKNFKRITYHVIANKKNGGYGYANNQAIQKAKGIYTLLLNSDAFLQDLDFTALLAYMDEHPQVGVLTVKVLLPTGGIDPASHRGFPTIWRSFTYFSGLEKLFGKIPVLAQLFGGYHLTHLNTDSVHEIDSPAGAFYLCPTTVLNKVKGFDTTFFMYGEDLDLSYRIKDLGYKVMYYPKYTVLHFKHTSGIKKPNKAIRHKTKLFFYDAMKIFYDKHYAGSYPSFVNSFVHFAIDLKSRL